MADEITIVVRAEDAFSNVLGNFGNIMTGIKSTIDLVSGAIHAFTGFAMEGLNSIAFYERLEASLTTLNAAQLVSHESAIDMASAMEITSIQAQELTKWMQEVAIKSPFTLEGVAQAFRLAEAYGFTAEQAKILTQDLIDFAAATGNTEYSMQRIALALGQIQAVGHLTGQDMLQLTQAGLPVAQILADYFGVTTEKVIEMRTAGLIPASDAIKAITEYIETNFAGAAERQANTWAGLMGTFSDIKQMGLREFFGGLFDALQPLAVSLSTWLQGPGMTILGTLGDMLGTITGNLVAKLAEFTPVFNTLNTAFLEFINLTNNDWTPLQALEKILGELAIIWKGTPLGDIVTDIREFIAIGESEGWGAAIKDLFIDITSGFDLQTTVQNILDRITTALGASDLQPLGQTIGNLLNSAITSVLSGLDVIINQVDWGPVGLALKTALGEMWKGAMEDTSLRQTLSDAFGNLLRFMWTGGPGTEAIVDEAKQNLKNDIIGMFLGLSDTINTWIRDNFHIDINASAFSFGTDLESIGKDMAKGIADGWSSLTTWLKGIFSYTLQDLIDDIKDFLGIKSPSTVFRSIGRDMIQGLIDGINSLAGSILNAFKIIINDILKLPGFQQIANVLGINTGGQGGATGSVDLGGTGGIGGKPGSGGTGTGATGASTVTYNFYGPVYMSGVPAPGSYDCPPNPIIQSGSNQVVTPGY